MFDLEELRILVADINWDNYIDEDTMQYYELKGVMYNRLLWLEDIMQYIPEDDREEYIMFIQDLKTFVSAMPTDERMGL